MTISPELISSSIELLGTVAFAISGAVVAIKKNMDLFGTIVLALVTAVGGGMIRDVSLGITPPNALTHPLFSIISVVTAIIIFIIAYISDKKTKSLDLDKLIEFLIFFDAVGLGSFTVSGIAVAINSGHSSSFLMLFTGILTGVGGGVIRDVFADTVPFILSRHIYASASIIGGAICIFLIKIMHLKLSVAMIIGAIIVIVIRLLAAKYKWNLPKLPS